MHRSELLWTQRLHFGPGARLGHAMAYDAARQRVVLFGGVDANSKLGDTWVWDGTFWTQVAETGPSPRVNHALAYDDARQQVVLFGGWTGNTHMSDTWAWDGVAWTQVAETGPSARSSHAMAGDDARARIVLFGGAVDDELGDTWEWDGTAWTQREERGPAPRRGHVMAYDATATRVVLFGGAIGNGMLDDTWEWNGVLWRQVAEFGAPGATEAAFSYAGRWSLLFGGAETAPADAGRDTTWEWDGHFWTEVGHFGPLGRSEHAIAFDSARRRLVLFGGTRQAQSVKAPDLLGDTWECPGREAIFNALTVAPTALFPGDTITVTMALSAPLTNDLGAALDWSVPGEPRSLPSTLVAPAGHTTATLTAVVPFGIPSGNYRVTASAGGVSRVAGFEVVVAAAGTLRISAVLPNPEGDEAQLEAVHVRNLGPTVIDLAGWRIADASGQSWGLDIADGTAAPGQVAIVTRQGRPMALANAGGTIQLMNPAGQVLDTKTYSAAASGQLIEFG